MRGSVAGLIVLVALAVGNAGNAMFHLVAARSIGPSRYGDLATLVTLLGLVSFPLTGVQYTLAQAIAYAAAVRDKATIASLFTRSLGIAAVCGAALTCLGAALAIPLQHALSVASLLAVLLTVTAVLPALVAPVASGAAQGLERFVLYSVAQVAGPVLRIVFLIPFLALGWSVAGAMGATLIAAALAAGGLVWWLRDWLRRERASAAADALADVKPLLAPAVIGILAFTSLTSADIVIAKLALGGHQTGLYGAASFTGRLILYLPAAIVSVLLPKVSSRAALGRETQSLLWLSMAATGLLCCVATGIYSLAPGMILRVAFGSAYVSADNLLWMFAVEMSLFALVNVVFVYELGHRRTRMTWLLVGGAVVQLCGYAAFHATATQLLVVNIATAAVLAAVSLVQRSGLLWAI